MADNEARSRARAARMLVRRHRSGVLSSHSLKFAGYPYGSALPHATDHAGRPVVLISQLAEHTRNLEADARASLIVCESGADLQAQPRVTVLGTTHPVADAARIERRYLRFYPEHAQYLTIGGFRFFALEPFQVRYIQGFGGLHWIAGESYLAPEALRDAEEEILAHMNRDHPDALRAYCRHVHDVDAQDPQMVGFDCDGFDVRAGERLLRFDFAEPVLDAGQARAALVELAQKSRDAR
jgi:putative heme iron utilization protein